MIGQDLRDVILAEPEVILEDGDVMAALAAASDRALGANVIDVRGIAMDRMGARLERLEDTHRTVVAAAYENLAATNQVHRAILQMLDPVTFEQFLLGLGTEVARTLRVDCIRLVLETVQPEGDPSLARLGDTLCIAGPGFVEDYLMTGPNQPPRPVTLRPTIPATARVCGAGGERLQSEALVRLDLGEGRLPGLLVLGAEDPHRFKPAQGTDLLAFFGGVFERSMRRWLS